MHPISEQLIRSQQVVSPTPGGQLPQLAFRLAPEPHGDVIGLVRGVEYERSSG